MVKEKLTRLTSQAYQQIPDTTKALIYCEDCDQAAAISIIGKKYHLPEPVLKFSKHFLEELAVIKSNGFHVTEAKVGFMVYWKGENEGVEVKIVLPEVCFER